MLVGIVMLGKRYKLLDYAAVVLLTVGLTLFSLADKAVRASAGRTPWRRGGQAPAPTPPSRR